MPPKLNPTPAYSSNVEIYGEVDSAGLTPRTPHSQAARAEEGRSRRVKAIPVNASIAEDEDGDLDEIDLLQTQSHPLLASSDSASFPFSNSRSSVVTSRWMGKQRLLRWAKDRLVKERIPLGLLAGSVVALVLLIMLVVSINRPDKLLDYMGVNATAIAFEALDDESKTRFNSSTVIDYAAAGYDSYPLTTGQYVHQCWKIMNDPKMAGWVAYWETKPGGDFDVLHKKPTSTPKTCTSSITYLLDGSVGLMADLAHLAQVAAHAREQNRTLFIYDRRWNRGQWTDHFLPFSETQPGPEPGCAAPPPEELVACPRTARHWITSALINYFHVGEGFADEFEDPYKYNIERKKAIFERAATSFAEGIRPSAINQKMIQSARSELGQLVVPTKNQTDGEYIAAHIRRGDRKAMSWRYNNIPDEQIPTSEYVDAVLSTYLHFQNSSSLDAPPLVYLATDSPTAASEFTNLITTNGNITQTHDNETAKPMVYELRTSADPELQALAPEMEYVQEQWSNRTEEDRIRETRGMVVDWAMLTGVWPLKQEYDTTDATEDPGVKPAAVICGLSSNVCKLAAVGLGWDRAFRLANDDPGPDKRWVEIDNGGVLIPIWAAFEVF